MCKGANCNERENCKRFLLGKDRELGWWRVGKSDPHKQCEIKIEE